MELAHAGYDGFSWRRPNHYAGLHQLCKSMLDHLGRLPVPQRDALATVLGLSSAPRPTGC